MLNKALPLLLLGGGALLVMSSKKSGDKSSRDTKGDEVSPDEEDAPKPKPDPNPAPESEWELIDGPHEEWSIIGDLKNPINVSYYKYVGNGSAPNGFSVKSVLAAKNVIISFYSKSLRLASDYVDFMLSGHMDLDCEIKDFEGPSGVYWDSIFDCWKCTENSKIESGDTVAVGIRRLKKRNTYWKVIVTANKENPFVSKISSDGEKWKFNNVHENFDLAIANAYGKSAEV